MQANEKHQLIGKDAGNYHIDRLLGKGPLSHFYEAHPVSGQRVMLTLFSLPETFSTQAHTHFLTRFKQEGEVLTNLKHPAIIPVYDYGEYNGYPFLVTPFVPGRSLAQILRSQSHFTVESVRRILRQVADGLDYAHRSGILHGTLSTANIVQGSEDTVQIAGFGFMHILAQQLFEQDNHANALLVNTIFSGLPARMAPEIVAAANGYSAPFDARVDVYALGILLFELLSGRLPFSGETPLEVAQQHAQQPIPSLSALRPALPASIDAVLQKAIARQLEQRFQAAGELTFAFEQALHDQYNNMNESAYLSQTPPEAETTWSLTTNHEREKDSTSGKQSVASVYPRLTLPLSSVHAPQQEQASDFDPFVWWTNVSSTQTVTHPKITKAVASTTQKVERHRQGRRKVVALLTAGSVVTIIGFGGGTIALAHLLRNQHLQPQTASTQPQLPTPIAKPQNPTPVAKPTSAPAAKPKKPAPTARPQSPTPTANAAPTPTPQPPVPTPTPKPQHTGTVIGSTGMGTNTAQSFSNGSNLLIHLPNGNFVAYSRACTHAGVPVNYDSGSHHLVCPAHGAVFDPANNANPISGPANGPLSAVTIHVNGDGTITA